MTFLQTNFCEHASVIPMKFITRQEEIGFLERKIGRTFFRRMGPRRGTPLFVLHGGPGSTHETFVEILELSKDRDLIIYDQIGCGRSSRIKKSEWTLKTFVQELEDLRRALGLKKIDILGHSWGTMLGAEYYFTHPKTVRSIIFSSPCLDAQAWSADAQRLLKKISPASQRAVAKALRTKKYSGAKFDQANIEYYDHFVNRFIPKKRPHAVALARAGFNLEGYLTMWGPVEFIATGSLKNFNRAKDLPHLAVPSLFTCGQYDEATPETVSAQALRTPGAKFHMFKKSSHMVPMEEPREYIRVMRKFLNGVGT